MHKAGANKQEKPGQKRNLQSNEEVEIWGTAAWSDQQVKPKPRRKKATAKAAAAAAQPHPKATATRKPLCWMAQACSGWSTASSSEKGRQHYVIKLPRQHLGLGLASSFLDSDSPPEELPAELYP